MTTDTVSPPPSTPGLRLGDARRRLLLTGPTGRAWRVLMFPEPAKHLPHSLLLMTPQDPALLTLNDNQLHAHRHWPAGGSPATAALIGGGSFRART